MGISLLLPGHWHELNVCAEQAQVSGDTPPALFAGYDVISVKPSKPGGTQWSINASKTTFEAKNVAILSLLVSAYGIRDALVFGLPKWSENTRWDISAKITDSTADIDEDHLTREQSEQRDRSKIRSILRERFQLKVHTEIRVMPVFNLVLLPGLLRFKVSTGDGKHDSMNWSNRELTGTGVPLQMMTQFLSDQVGRNVIDKTGLTGLYDVTLKWSPDELAEAAVTSDTNDWPPALPQALQEQLGLKLVPSKGPSETLVVDTIQEPMPD